MKLIFWSAIIFFIGSVVLFISNYSDVKVERNGTIVKMRIEKLPNSCLGTKIKHFVILSYGEETYTKRIGGKFCDEHTVGDMIDMKYLEGSPVVLFPSESAMSNLIAFVILGVLGLGMLIYYWSKSKQ